jgi:streptomycin 6-kinase
MEALDPLLHPYLVTWKLEPDGDVLVTRSSRLLPVRRAGTPAILKLALIDEEQRGNRLMAWWQGDGAARVLAHDDHALLMERAAGPRSLTEMARSGRDDEASRIICAVAGRLHRPRRSPPADAVPLQRWFRALQQAAPTHGDFFARAAAEAASLLAAQQNHVILHGDLHHGNILDGGERGWLVIDPKCLIGERGFDFANILCNPDAAIAARPGRLARQASIIADAARLDRKRLLRWIIAWCGLSAAFALEDGGSDSPDHLLAIGMLAAAELEKS